MRTRLLDLWIPGSSARGYRPATLVMIVFGRRLRLNEDFRRLAFSVTNFLRSYEPIQISNPAVTTRRVL